MSVKVDKFTVRLVCCGVDDGVMNFDTYHEADAFREGYTSGVAVDPHGYSGNDGGHQRCGIIEALTHAPAEGG